MTLYLKLLVFFFSMKYHNILQWPMRTMAMATHIVCRLQRKNNYIITTTDEMPCTTALALTTFGSMYLSYVYIFHFIL